LHPYTKDLLSAIPLAGELGIEKVTLKGEIGDPTNPQRVAELQTTPKMPIYIRAV
jgi:ABC-type oligopeptide transport system ATPase subunit